MPKTILGKWAVGLIITFFLFLVLLQLLVAFGEQGGQTFFSNLKLAFTGILVGASGVLAFFVGIFSIIKRKERSILVFISTGIGFLILLFILGEILFPH